MKLAPNENLLRVALLVFSIIFGMLSVSLIALGIVYIDELWWPQKYIDGLQFLDFPSLIIALGFISLFLSITGCFCAKSYNRKIFITFVSVLILTLSCELTVAIMAFLTMDRHSKHGHTHTRTLLTERLNDTLQNNKSFFNKLEQYFYCCNLTGQEMNCSNPHMIGCIDAINNAIIGFEREISNIFLAFAFSHALEVVGVFCILYWITIV